MTSLLVSVRSAAEAQAALAGGADVIDVKEPTRGALGRSDASVWSEVAEVLQGQAPLSVALGELTDPPSTDSLAPADAASPPITWAKLGLANCGNIDWANRWRERRRDLPKGAKSVAVVYADWQVAKAPSPEAILREAIGQSCAALLIDTFTKNGESLFDWITPEDLSDLFAAAHRAGMITAAAGSLTQPLLEAAIQSGADIIAVRGAACEGPRTGVVSERLVSQLAQQINRLDQLSEQSSACRVPAETPPNQ